MVRNFVDLRRLCLLAAFVGIVVVAQKNETNDDVETFVDLKPNSPKSEEIVDGLSAKPGEFPYMASMRVNGVHFCGGAIITSRHILTAAHCVQPHVNNTNSRVDVVTGSISLQSGGVRHEVIWMYYHSGYSPSYIWNNDIGILKLRNPIVFNNFQKPITISSIEPPVNAIATVTGWGNTRGPPNTRSTDVLQKLNVVIISRSQCQTHHPKSPIYNNMLCTFNQVNQATCNGDSGSPLVYLGKLVGTVSGGTACGLGVADIYTNIIHFTSYINTITSLP